MKSFLPVSALSCLLVAASVSTACGKKKDAATAAAGPTLTVTGSGSAAGTALLDQPTNGAGGAAVMTVGLSGMYVSLNEDCSSPVLVAQNSAQVDVDLASSPALFTGSPDAGTYKCVMMAMSDMLKIKPDAAAVAAWPSLCVSGTEYSGDICHTNDTDWKDQTGAALTCHSDAADQVVIYASTNVAAPVSGPLHVSENQVVKLTTGLVVPGTATFYVDSTNAIVGEGGGCNLEKPVFGFR